MGSPAAGLLGIGLTLAFGVSACSLQQADSGEPCVRTTECKVGLACVQGKCSTNIQSIADDSVTPKLDGEDAGASRDAGPDAEIELPDANVAGSGGTGGSGGNAGMSGGDASMPDRDAAMSGNDAG